MVSNAWYHAKLRFDTIFVQIRNIAVDSIKSPDGRKERDNRNTGTKLRMGADCMISRMGKMILPANLKFDAIYPTIKQNTRENTYAINIRMTDKLTYYGKLMVSSEIVIFLFISVLFS